jgi:oligopeptidase B
LSGLECPALRRDARVCLDASKYVARLRTLKTDANPLLLVTNMQAGHGGASGRYDYLKEIAQDYAFVLRELGLC